MGGGIGPHSHLRIPLAHGDTTAVVTEAEQIVTQQRCSLRHERRSQRRLATAPVGDEPDRTAVDYHRTAVQDRTPGQFAEESQYVTEEADLDHERCLRVEQHGRDATRLDVEVHDLAESVQNACPPPSTWMASSAWADSSSSGLCHVAVRSVVGTGQGASPISKTTVAARSIGCIGVWNTWSDAKACPMTA